MKPKDKDQVDPTQNKDDKKFTDICVFFWGKKCQRSKECSDKTDLQTDSLPFVAAGADSAAQCSAVCVLLRRSMSWSFFIDDPYIIYLPMLYIWK